jgi:P4 family phage/plasmid primase-like protien
MYNDETEKIRSTLDIVDVARKYRTLKDKGDGTYRTAFDSSSKSGESLKISRNEQAFYDFAAHGQGDVFDLIGLFEGLDTRGGDFPEVLRIAAGYAGIELQQTGEPELYEELKAVHGLYMDVARQYHGELKARPDLVDHVKTKWGISEETIDSLLIGFAPAKNNLAQFEGSVLNKSGLVLKFDNGIKEFFQGRIIFPYWKNDKVVYMIARSVDGETPDNQYEHAKYKKLLTHSEKRPYISRVVGNQYLYGEDSIKGVKDAILITEGVTDCITAIQAGIPTISPVTTQFRDADREKILKVSKHVKNVFICNDNEISEAGIKGALKTADMLEGAGIMVKIIELPKGEDDKMDLAEYLKTHDKTDILRLMEHARDTWSYKLNKVVVPQSTREKFRAFTEFITEDLHFAGNRAELEEFIKSDVCDKFGLSKRPVNDLLAKIKKQSAKDPVQEEEPDVCFFDDENRLKPLTLAQHIMKDYYFITMSDNGAIYRYKDGIYIPDGENIINQCVLELLGDAGRQRHCSEVIHQIKHRRAVDRNEIVMNTNRLCLRNGIYDRITKELEPHNPDEVFLTQIPVDYDPEATCPLIEKFFNEVMRPGDIPVFKELIGYCLIPDYSIEKATALFGGGENGKSVALNVMSAFIGVDNISRVPLQHLTDDPYAMSDLYGKLANIYPDLSDNMIRDTSTFKTLTGNEAGLRAQRKYERAFHFKNYAKLVFSANKLPPVPGADYAFWRRWNLIEFPWKVPEERQDEHLDKKLTVDSELSGLLNEALSALDALMLRGKFVKSDTAEEVESVYVLHSDPIMAFVNECVNTITEEYTSKNDMYIAYIQWADAVNITATTKNKFGRRLKNNGFEDGFSPIREEDGKQPRVWFNCEIKYDKIEVVKKDNEDDPDEPVIPEDMGPDDKELLEYVKEKNGGTLKAVDLGRATFYAMMKFKPDDLTDGQMKYKIQILISHVNGSWI